MLIRSVFIFLAVPVVVGAVEPFPSVVLDNGELRIVVDLPDAEVGRYRGGRYDWSGHMPQAQFRGYEFFGPWRELDADGLFRDGMGPCEEFGMDNPPGYAEAAIGDAFVKIGVGLLQRVSAADYQFLESYPVVKLGEWSNSHGRLWVESVQVLDSDLGWAYRYSKRIELHPDRPQFTISRKLENTGTRRIDTDHYVHNFVILGGRVPDSAVELITAFNIRPGFVLNNSIHFDGFRIHFPESMKPGGHYLNLVEKSGISGELPAAFNFGLWRDRKSGLQVQFHGDQPLHKFVFYGIHESLSLEPFVPVRVDPGNSMRWHSVYYFSEQARD